MITCTQCGNENLEGSLICEKCNYFFGGEGPTPRLVRTSGLLARAGYKIQSENLEHQIILNPSKLFQSREEFVTGRLILGRGDNNGQYTYLRVSVVNAVDLGVSRCHAAIIPYSDGVAVQDIGSTNGTYLNGERLVPNRYYWLAHGDLLRLGELNLRVYLEN